MRLLFGQLLFWVIYNLNSRCCYYDSEETLTQQNTKRKSIDVFVQTRNGSQESVVSWERVRASTATTVIKLLYTTTVSSSWASVRALAVRTNQFWISPQKSFFYPKKQISLYKVSESTIQEHFRPTQTDFDANNFLWGGGGVTLMITLICSPNKSTNQD